MRYRRFGRTNLCLSVLSLGTMRYLASESLALQTIQRAIDQGINHLETAQGYGQSERYLGTALRELGLARDRLYLTTKLSPSLDADAMARGIDHSLDRLGTDYIDCLALHGLNTWEQWQMVLSPQGCLPALHRAVAEGRVRHLGFSTHGPLELILDAIASDIFAFVNLHYYWFNQRNAAAVRFANQQDMGVFIISPADKGGMLHQPPDRLRQLCHPFTPLELTYRFLLSQPSITTLSVGAAQASELETPLQLADRDQPLTPDEQAALQRLTDHLRSTLATDWCSQCNQCLPCPEAIQIPEVLRLRNLAVAFEMTEFGAYRYRMFENAGHWFPGRKGNRCTDCGDCLPRCPQQLNIPYLLRDTHDRLNGAPRRRLWED